MNDTIKGLPNGDFEVTGRGALICRLCGKRRGEHRFHTYACVSSDPTHNHWHPFNRFLPSDEVLQLPKIDESMPKAGASLTWPTIEEPHAHIGIMTLSEIAAAEDAVRDPEPRKVSKHPALGMPYGHNPLGQAGYWLGETSPKHGHYYKDVSKLQHVDVYRVLSLFAVTDPCLQHAVKKLLVAGGRGAGKSIDKDVQEAIDTLTRWQAMRAEEPAL
jgi:hypothetical protein